MNKKSRRKHEVRSQLPARLGVGTDGAHEVVCCEPSQTKKGKQ